VNKRKINIILNVEGFIPSTKTIDLDMSTEQQLLQHKTFNMLRLKIDMMLMPP